MILFARAVLSWGMLLVTLNLACCGIASSTTPRDSPASEASVWLEMRLGGGPPAQDVTTLEIDVKGTVRVEDNSGRYRLILQPEQLAELRQAVKAANLRVMAPEYPTVGADDLWAEITLTEGGEKRNVTVYRGSPKYPTRLKPLLDLTMEGQVYTQGRWREGGRLAELLYEALEHPLAAIVGHIEAERTSYRVGESIKAALVVKNVGRLSAWMPSKNCKEIVSGEIGLRLQPHPLNGPPWVIDETNIKFGPDYPYLEYHDTLGGLARRDLLCFVWIAPGGTWRVQFPKPLVARSPGEYQITGYMTTTLLYNKTQVEQELGGYVVTGPGEIKTVILRVEEGTGAPSGP
jgi:hypothetical protein